MEEPKEAMTESAGENTAPAMSPEAPAAEAEVSLAEQLEALRKELEQVRAQAQEYLEGWQRERAAFANYRKRVEAERAQFAAEATALFIRKLLPILDDFERALRTLPDNLRHLTWVEGVALIYRKLQLALESEGVRPIEVKPGDPFDPMLHEAVLYEPAEGFEDGQIVEELQRGYKLGDRVLRPTLVKVARKAEPGSEPSAAEGG
ncbi:nucleotide exchange factor GrpE [Thermoflexus sp.]|uniref:nucleotide exchange factor GrpE n=1 Tax=Thermoflexus sp. TaxID=1969742 RepID=UPI002635E5DD|nr:nucleotide exchange factor GrpE [Thermoflexus sp.]